MRLEQHSQKLRKALNLRIDTLIIFIKKRKKRMNCPCQ